MSTRHKMKRITGLIIGLVLTTSLVSGAGAKEDKAGDKKGTTGPTPKEIYAGSNRVENITLTKDEHSIALVLDNPKDESCLWIKAHGCDNRKMEHGGLLLRIEVNGVVLEKERSISQGNTYRYPVHPIRHMTTLDKYNEEEKAWPFKFDVDFVMNNNTGSPGNWSSYTTLDYNHWYAFDLKGIAVKGTNRVVIAECLKPGRWKTDNYDGFVVGKIGLFSPDEIKAKVNEYNARQIKIDPKELVVKTAPIPEGRAVKSEVKDGYIVKNGKPFLHLHYQGHDDTVDAARNMLYFNWGNTLQVHDWAVAEAAGYEDYLTPNWKEQKIVLSLARNQLADAYANDLLMDLYFTYFNVHTVSMSPMVEKRIPDLYAVDSRGSKCEVGDHGGFFPNLNSALYKSYIDQVISLMGSDLAGHPALFANVAHEELIWRCAATYLPPQDEESRKGYRKFLKDKYADLEKLNQEWGTTYKDWNEVAPPKTREQSANFINFQLFRSKIIEDYTQNIYDASKKYFPEKLITAERTGTELRHRGWMSAGHPFFLTRYCDIKTIGADGIAYVRALARYFGEKEKVLQPDICFACPYRFTDPMYRQGFWDQAPLVKDKNGVEMRQYNFGNQIMHDFFEGGRSFFYFSYDASRHHIIHHSIKDSFSYAGKEKKVSKEVKDFPANLVEEKKARDIGDVHALLYKIAPLALPAKADAGKVALLSTIRSSLVGFTIDASLQGKKDSETSEWSYLQKLLTHIQVPFEVVTEYDLEKELDKYKVLIAGYWATMGSKAMAEKIKDFVAKGGTVIFYPEAFAYDWETTKTHANSPGYDLDKLFCARIKTKISGKESTLKIEQDMPGSVGKGDTFKVEGLVTPLEKLEGGNVLATLADSGEPLIISANNDRTYYLGFAVGCSYAASSPDGGKVRALLSHMIEKAGVERPIQVKADKKDYLVYARVLRGKDYYVLGFCNDYWEEQNIEAQVNSLPAGKYELVDVTEEVPVTVSMLDLSGTDKSRAGIKMTLPPLSRKIMIAREAGRQVVVNCPEYEIGSIIKNYPTDIVVGKNASGSVLDLAGKIREKLKSKGIVCNLLKDEEVPVVDKSVTLSKVVCPAGTMTHKVIGTENNLILVGNAQDNRLIANLESKEAYTYDKVSEDVNSTHPGKGRGIIQVAESVNKPYYCPTDKGRDAILVSGSDESGTTAAMNKFLEIINTEN